MKVVRVWAGHTLHIILGHSGAVTRRDLHTVISDAISLDRTPNPICIVAHTPIIHSKPQKVRLETAPVQMSSSNFHKFHISMFTSCFCKKEKERYKMYNNSLFAPHFDLKVSIYRTVSPAALRPRPLVLVVVAGVRPIHPLLHHLGGHLVRLLMVNNVNIWST